MFKNCSGYKKRATADKKSEAIRKSRKEAAKAAFSIGLFMLEGSCSRISDHF